MAWRGTNDSTIANQKSCCTFWTSFLKPHINYVERRDQKKAADSALVPPPIHPSPMGLISFHTLPSLAPDFPERLRPSRFWVSGFRRPLFSFVCCGISHPSYSLARKDTGHPVHKTGMCGRYDDAETLTLCPPVLPMKTHLALASVSFGSPCTFTTPLSTSLRSSPVFQHRCLGHHFLLPALTLTWISLCHFDRRHVSILCLLVHI